MSLGTLDPQVHAGRPAANRRIPRALLAALAVLVVVAATCVAVRLAAAPHRPVQVALHGDAVWPAGAHPAPAFALRDQEGRPVSLAGQHGHVVVLTFLSSLCTGQCPLEARQLADAARQLPASLSPVLLVVSVDSRDTPATATAFMREAGLDGRWPWHWLTGSPQQLRAVWSAYGIDVQPGSDDVAHSVVVYLVDPSGGERSGYLMPLRVADLAHDLRSLAASG